MTTITPGSGSLGLTGGPVQLTFLFYTITPGTGSVQTTGQPVREQVQNFRTDITPQTGALGLTPGTPGAMQSAQRVTVPDGTPLPEQLTLLPEPSRVPAEMNYDQTIAYVADQFEVALNDSNAFRTEPEFATLDSGLLDPYLVPDFIEHINQGFIDDLELHGIPNRMSSVIRGRDAAAYVVDSTLYITYSTKADLVAAQTVPPAIQGFPTIPVIVGVTVPLVLPGPWTARRIAEDLVKRIGTANGFPLSCSFQSYDYTLREDFVVNGPILSALQQLVEPFNHFESSKVDIFLDGHTLVIRNRTNSGGTVQTPTVHVAGAGIALDVHDTRISDLMIRKSFQGFIRVLRIMGSQTGTALIAVDPGDKTVVTEDETLAVAGDTDSSGQGTSMPPGTVKAKTVTTEVIRILDNACKSKTIDTYMDVIDAQGILRPMAHVSQKETVSDWDDLQLGFPNVILNSPKENTQTTTESGLDTSQSSAQLTPQKRTIVANAYSPDGYLEMQRTSDLDYDSSPAPASIGPVGWVASKIEVKQYRRNGAGMYEITTTEYGADGSVGSQRRTTANGTPPGGPGRSTSNNISNEQQVTFGTLISTEPGAKDVTISNKSILPVHMNIIANQARAFSGSTEVEINFTAAGMPWLKRGQIITLTGLVAEDGITPIPLQPALVSECKIEYREGSPNATYQTYVKALYWKK